MRRALFRNVSLYATTFTKSPQIPQSQTLNLIPKSNLPIFHRFFSEDSASSDQNPNLSPAAVEQTSLETFQEKNLDLVDDVDNEEVKSRLVKYFEGDEEALPSVLDGVLSKKLSGKHEDTDDELTADAEDKEFSPDFEEAKQKEYVDDPKECEEILEDMLYGDKLLPEDIKQKVQAKRDELAEKMENNGLEVEKASEQFKAFQDEIVAEHIKKDEEERLLPESDEVAKPVDNKSDDPPGVGPILRWQTQLVFVPGGDAWHPKNKKVKLSVTVKELGLSKHQFRRMRELVGKRYHSGKDELTITSERFEHREENRKDCLRTLLSIIEEAGKADALVDEARTAYIKQRLKANPEFMARLHAKTKQVPIAIPA